MSECVIALAKISTGKRCDFSWPYVRLSATTNHHPPTIKAPPKNKN